jgi:hypothetical protein
MFAAGIPKHENPPPAPLFLRGELKSPFAKGGFRGISRGLE